MTGERKSLLRQRTSASILTVFLLPMLQPLTASNDPVAAQRLQQELRQQIEQEPPASDDPQAITVINSHWQVADPDQRWATIQALHYKGKIRDGRNEFTAERITKAPDKSRDELKRRHLGRQHHDLQVRNGTARWQQTLAPQQSAPQQLPVINDSFERGRDHHGLLHNHSRHGVTLSWVGQKQSRGRAQNVVRLHFADKTFADAWFDAERGILTRLTRPKIVGNSVLEDDIFFTSYHRVAGVWLPATTEFMVSGQLRRRESWESIITLPSVDDALFSPPQRREVILRQKTP